MKILTFDFETSKAPLFLPWIKGSYPVSLCLKMGDSSKLKTWIFNHSEISPLQTVNIAEIQEYFDKADIIIAHNCFTGEEEYITPSGYKSFKDTVGTTQKVLTRKGWMDATIHWFGKNGIRKLEVVPYNRSRTSIKHTLEVTGGHRWIVDRIYITNKFGRQRKRVPEFLTTDQLKVGDNIISQVPTSEINIQSDAFRHGLIFADGAKVTDRNAYQIRLCGWKGVFKECFKSYTYPKSSNGDPVVNYYPSIIPLKELPQDTSVEYITNFIEGWRLLDGTERVNNTTVVTTTVKEHADWLVNNASLGGWYCTGISEHKIKDDSFGSIGTPYWMVTITKDSNMAWTVKSIKNTDTDTDTYCAVVPDEESFTLKHGIYTGNCKFDLHWLRAIGINTRKNRYFCTMVAEYVLTNQDKLNNNLKDCSVKYGLPDKIDLVKEWWDSGYDTFDIPLSTLIPYGEQDVLNCEAIFLKQMELIRAEKRGKIVQLRCESLRVTQEIEWNGMCIDTKFATEMSIDYGRQIDEINLSIYAGIREALPELSIIPFNLGSGDHLSAILFGGKIKYKGRVAGKKEGTERNGDVIVATSGLGFIPMAKSETKKEGYYKTDITQVESLKAKTQIQKDFIAAVQALSKMEKMKGTYCDGLLDKEIDGIVHPTVNEAITATGRYSSSNPNSQNIPREGTSRVKELFITRYKEDE